MDSLTPFRAASLPVPVTADGIKRQGQLPAPSQNQGQNQGQDQVRDVRGEASFRSFVDAASDRPRQQQQGPRSETQERIDLAQALSNPGEAPLPRGTLLDLSV
ncbi:MAG: hypothetical protein NXI16_04565 [Alphaproteobacteria bacterium]|nr:hypothetical protein [Alphaproteobacteria bacterium]